MNPNRHVHPHLHRLLSLALLVATLGVFGQVLGHEFVGYDDYSYVFRNPHVLKGLRLEGVGWAFNTLHFSNWHPLTWLSHMVDVEFYALFAGGHLFTNLILHLISGLLLYLFLRESTGRLVLSAVVAGIFLLHPTRAESVAWLSERKDVLCGLFWMAAMLAYGSYTRRPALARYMAVALLFGLALLSKPMAVTLPFVFLLLDYWPLTRGSAPNDPPRLPDPWLWAEKVPFFAMSLGSSVMTWIAQSQGGAMAPLHGLSLAVRLGNTLVSYVKYIGMFFWPVDLGVFYPHSVSFGGYVWWQWGPALLFLGVVTLLVVVYRRRLPFAFTGWLWFLGMLVPVIGLVQVGAQSHADRYTYLPYVGLALATVFGAERLLDRFGLGGRAKGLVAAAIFAVLIPLCAVQVSYWSDTYSLFGHTAEVTENNFLAHLVMANKARTERDEKAFYRHYTEAVESSPGFVAEEHLKAGFWEARAGLYESALEHFVQAKELLPNNARILANLGVVYGELDRYDIGQYWLEKALEIEPDNDFTKAQIYVIKEEKMRVKERLKGLKSGIWRTR